MATSTERLFVLAQHKRIAEPEYHWLGRKGPDHRPEFIFICIVGHLSAIGSGKRKKEAKQNAAQLVLDLLQV